MAQPRSAKKRKMKLAALRHRLIVRPSAGTQGVNNQRDVSRATPMLPLVGHPFHEGF
jgi:hypothetical protein